MSRRFTRALAALTIAAGVASVADAEAFHAGELPLLASHTSTEPGWMSFAVETDGAPVAFDISVEGLKGASRINIAQYREDRSWRQTSALSVYPDKDGVLVQVSAGPLEHHQDSITRTSSSTGRFSIGTRLNHPPVWPSLVGTERVLFWWGGTGTFSLAVRGAPGATINATDSGNRAFFLRSHDLAGSAHAEGWTRQTVTTYKAGAGARAQIDTGIEIDVQDTLLLNWDHGLTAADLVTLETPAGTRICTLDHYARPPAVGGISDKPCALDAMTGSNAAGPGRYAFNVSGAGLADHYLGDIWVGGADARLA